MADYRNFFLVRSLVSLRKVSERRLMAKIIINLREFLGCGCKVQEKANNRTGNGSQWNVCNDFVINLCDEAAIQTVMLVYRENHFVSVAGIVDGDNVRVMRIGGQGTEQNE